MTIDSLYFPERYIIGEHLEYSFTFEVLEPDHVEVFLVAADGTRTALVYNTDYTVELSIRRDPIFKNGVVTLTTPQTAGLRLDIERKTDITNEQPADTFEAFGPFNTEAFEYSIDKLTMICQEIDGHLCDCRECLAPVSQLSLSVNGELISANVSSSQTFDVREGDLLLLESIVNAGTSPFTYEWRIDDVPIAGETSNNYSITLSGDGTFEYAVVVGNECGTRVDRVSFNLDVEFVDPQCFPYICSALYDTAIVDESIRAYFPLGTAGFGIPDLVDGQLGRLPDVKEPSGNNDIQLQANRDSGAFVSVNSGTFQASSCSGSEMLRIDRDVFDATTGRIETPYTLLDIFGELALSSNGLWISLVALPELINITPGSERDVRSGLIIQYSGFTFGSANYPNNQSLPENRANFDFAFRIAINGTDVDSRDLLITTPGNIPNNGFDTNFILPNVFRVDDTFPTLITMGFRIDPVWFESTDTQGRPATNYERFLRADKLDGSILQSSQNIWETQGYGASSNASTFLPLTQLLHPDNFIGGSAPAAFFDGAWQNPYWSDLMIHDGSNMEGIATAWRRSDSSYQIPAFCNV